MKNVLFLFLFMGGFALHNLDAQNCQPCPLGSCPIKCCKANEGNSAASVSLMPNFAELVSLNCTPQEQAACMDAAKLNNKEQKACQPACMAKANPSCTGAATTAPKPSTELIIDQQYHKRSF